MIATALQTPRRGRKLPAQGIALGIVKPRKVALKGQKHYMTVLLPFQGDGHQHAIIPRALPWADSFLAFQAVSSEKLPKLQLL